VVVFALTFAARAALSGALGYAFPYGTFFIAIVIAAAYGGWGPGVLTLGLSVLAALEFFIPRGPLLPNTLVDYLGLAFFVANGLLVSGLAGTMHRARTRMEARAAELEREAAGRRRAEDDRERAGAEHRGLLESVGDGVLVVDGDMRYRFANAAGLEMLGRTTGQVMGRRFAEVNPELAGSELERSMSGAIAAHSPARVDVCPGAGGRWFAMGIYPSGGGAALLARDITDRIIERRNLEKRNDLLSLLAEAAGHVLATEDPGKLMRGVFERISSPLGVDAYFNYTVSETGDYLRLASCAGISEEAVRDLQRLEFGQWICGTVAELRQPLVATHIQTSDYDKAALVRSFGVRVYACNPLMAGDRLLGTLSFASRSRDLFETDELEFFRAVCHYLEIALERLQLQGELKRHAELLDQAHDAILAVRPDRSIEFWNRGAELMYGWSAAEAVGRQSHELLETVFPEPIEGIERAVQETGSWQGEVTHKRRDGSEIAVFSRWALDRRGEGPRYGFLEINRDLTERKKFEERMRQAAKLESLGVLAGGIAHDFNNLLVGIMGNASLALETTPPESTDRTLLEGVIKASERAADLTRQLLAYAGKGRASITSFDLSELVREIASLVSASIPKDVQLDLDLADGLPAVEGDTSQIHQVIMNLVINGAEAIGQTCGTVRVSTRLESVDAASIASLAVRDGISPGTFAALEVHDTGCGMDESTLARIFDPFFTTKFQGRGLGLAAVQGIIRVHRGALKVDSRLGSGTTFKVLLPASAGAAPLGAAQPRRSESLTGSGTILIIDDEPLVRDTAAAALKRYGYAVLTAADGREGAEVFRTRTAGISAVLLDLVMPVMGGEQALTRILEIDPGACVVLSSGYNESEAMRRFAGRGLAGFIQKPYSAAALAAKMRSVLQPEPQGEAPVEHP
jgi:PAS domain S-box-containing protein